MKFGLAKLFIVYKVWISFQCTWQKLIGVQTASHTANITHNLNGEVLSWLILTGQVALAVAIVDVCCLLGNSYLLDIA